jgi:hypothetical protein
MLVEAVVEALAVEELLVGVEAQGADHLLRVHQVLLTQAVVAAAVLHLLAETAALAL